MKRGVCLLVLLLSLMLSGIELPEFSSLGDDASNDFTAVQSFCEVAPPAEVQERFERARSEFLSPGTLLPSLYTLLPVRAARGGRALLRLLATQRE